MTKAPRVALPVTRRSVSQASGLRRAPGDPRPRDWHRTIPGYAPTPLVHAPTLAERLGVGRVLVKNEQQRLQLPSFKILGASWAVHRALCQRLEVSPELRFDELRDRLAGHRHLVLTCATDGNHGRAVAHMAKLLGLTSTVYVPNDLSQPRITAIEDEGAEVVRVFGTYDDAVRYTAVQAARHPNQVLVSDTSWPGYETVPRFVVQGYETIFDEIDDDLRAPGTDARTDPHVVLVPVGVGALASAVISRWPGDTHTRVVTVEPDTAACVQQSLALGAPTNVPGPHLSIMAGLNCGEPSMLAWPVLAAGVAAAVAVNDDEARAAMRDLATAGIVAGESGAAALAGAHVLFRSDEGRDALRGLEVPADATVLLLNTEGAADPDSYSRIVHHR